MKFNVFLCILLLQLHAVASMHGQRGQQRGLRGAGAQPALQPENPPDDDVIPPPPPFGPGEVEPRSNFVLTREQRKRARQRRKQRAADRAADVIPPPPAVDHLGGLEPRPAQNIPTRAQRNRNRRRRNQRGQ